MKSKRYLIGALLFLNQLLIAQIGAKTKAVSPSIQGVWQNSEMGFQMVLMLNADGSGEFDGEAIKYTSDAKHLIIQQNGDSNTYAYVLHENSLQLSRGDLEGPITFTKLGTSNASTKPQPQPTTTSKTVKTKPQPSNNSQIADEKKLIGIWSGYGETIEFTSDKNCNYLGQTYPYSVSQEHIVLETPQGDLMLAYQITGNQLSLTTNGKTLVYSKGGTATKTPSNTNGGPKKVAPELVGKWCYVNVNSYNNGGSSTEECIVLNANGTYQYGYESSRSVNTDTYYGGTNSSDSDSGTWWVQGTRVFYNSTMGKGQGSYELLKQNHPKSNDPMIVLDGKTYVSYYKKNPW